jgi:hypothetical protein
MVRASHSRSILLMEPCTKRHEHPHLMIIMKIIMIIIKKRIIIITMIIIIITLYIHIQVSSKES